MTLADLTCDERHGLRRRLAALGDDLDGLTGPEVDALTAELRTFGRRLEQHPCQCAAGNEAGRCDPAGKEGAA